MNRQSNDLLDGRWKNVVSVTFEYTPADHFFATYALRRRFISIWIVYLLAGVFPLILGAMLLVTPGGRPDVAFMPWLLALPFLVFVIAPLLTWAKVNRVIRTTPAARGPRTVTFGDEGMSAITEVSQTDLKWATFVKVVETNRYFFFFLSPRVPIFIPKRFLPDPNDLRDLRHLIRVNLGDKAHLQRQTD